MKTKKFTLSTATGCARILIILLCVILLASFCAQMISTNSGAIKISKIQTDFHGGVLTFDQYIPAGTRDTDSLPAVVVIHGGGCPAGVVRTLAEELARSGFVVVNVNAYGAGTSEQPYSDDGGQGVDGFNPFGGPAGVLDATNYLRSLPFVDSERIGLVGHSLGATRTSMAAVADCGYLSLNDILINELCEKFGVEVSEEDLNRSADEIAKEKLNDDQMSYYEAIKAEKTEYFNSRIKSICILGSDGKIVMPQSTVTVGGHEVTRSLQTNIAVINGTYDTSGRGTPEKLEAVVTGLYGADNIAQETWYAVDDAAASAKELGAFGAITVESSAPLAEAIDGRSARVLLTNVETHSKNFFSVQTATDVVRYVEQGLSYNVNDTRTANSFVLRAILNCIAMLAMIAMIGPLVALLVKTPFFKECVANIKEECEATAYHKKTYWIFAAVIVIYTFIAIYFGNNKGIMHYPINHTWPLAGTAGNTLMFVFILAGCSLGLMVIYALLGKKQYGETGLGQLVGGIKVTGVLKSILLALIVLVVGYSMLSTSIYLFNQDFRFWTCSFGEMRPELWLIAARYALVFTPVFLLTGAVTNYTIRKDIPEWADTLINIIIGSLGVWLCCAVDLLLCKAGYNGTHFSAFTCSYSMLLYVPITVYISRKVYNQTKNIWAGAFINALFLAWSFTASQTLSDAYFGQTFWSMFLGG